MPPIVLAAAVVVLPDRPADRGGGGAGRMNFPTQGGDQRPNPLPRRSSQLPQVESSGFLGGPRGCLGLGVAHEHVWSGPPGDGHKAGLRAPGGEPAVGCGVPQAVGVEVLDPGDVGALAQGGVLELPDDATVNQALEALEVPGDHVHLVMVNNQMEKDRDRALAADDELIVLPPVGAG